MTYCSDDCKRYYWNAETQEWLDSTEIASEDYCPSCGTRLLSNGETEEMVSNLGRTGGYEAMKCVNCGGKGQRIRIPRAGGKDIMEECPRCQGRGTVCDTSGGHGIETIERMSETLAVNCFCRECQGSGDDEYMLDLGPLLTLTLRVWGNKRWQYQITLRVQSHQVMGTGGKRVGVILDYQMRSTGQEAERDGKARLLEIIAQVREASAAAWFCCLGGIV